MTQTYEIERDRFGIMYSGPLEVGECVEVVPVAEYERLRRWIDTEGRNCPSNTSVNAVLADMMHTHYDPGAELEGVLRATIWKDRG